MSLSLRDLFAAHVAGSLATRVDTADAIAVRAYDLADAMLRERARRAPAASLAQGDVLLAEELEIDGADEEPAWLDFELGARGATLLDEPAPVSERDDEPDPRWIEREERDPNSYDPRWEAEPVALPGSSAPSSPRGVERPGLARTAPAVTPQRKEKTA